MTILQAKRVYAEVFKLTRNAKLVVLKDRERQPNFNRRVYLERAVRMANEQCACVFREHQVPARHMVSPLTGTTFTFPML